MSAVVHRLPLRAKRPAVVKCPCCKRLMSSNEDLRTMECTTPSCEDKGVRYLIQFVELVRADG